MVSRYSAYRRGSDAIPPDVIDRILLGACAAIWLVLLGVSVAAAVALSDLSRGFHKTASSPHTTWVLYAVIIVSALIIAGAVPVLVRARRMTQPDTEARPASTPARGTGRPLLRPGSPTARTVAERAREPRAQAGESTAVWSGAEVDRVWLRGTVILTATMGAALIAVAAATYSMAVGHDGPSWVGYGIAGLITAAMPVAEWFQVRQLRQLIGTP
ncbi:membrane protein [Mycobacterium numidiamassiliense]|jgi:hypothetical protein|uniref:Membrane protein n=1 Tax=Mycobacterium numidiamassiliense TaxID=1841861 RepID=A0A2U3PEM3_9MYCO|nr:DUF2561 family protein [Mycobacterium numidiamassiliense]SPM42183.1 membrane protein [Mycobacterium numidiamassiliense]